MRRGDESKGGEETRGDFCERLLTCQGKLLTAREHFSGGGGGGGGGREGGQQQDTIFVLLSCDMTPAGSQGSNCPCNLDSAVTLPRVTVTLLLTLPGTTCLNGGGEGGGEAGLELRL